MKKRIAATILSAALMAGTLAGSTSVYAQDAAADAYNIVFTYGIGEAPDDSVMERVSKAVSDYTMEKIGCTVTLQPVAWADWTNKLNLALATSSEHLDVIAVAAGFYAPYVSQKQLTDITDLVDEIYPEYVETFGQGAYDCGLSNGRLYRLPCVSTSGTSTGLILSKPIADELGLDVQSVHTLEDLEPLLEQVKEAYPDMYPFVPSAALAIYDMDDLGDSNGVLMDASNSLEVVNLYATDEFRAFAELMYDWFDKGYIAPDILTSGSFGEFDVRDGDAFACLTADSAIRKEHEAGTETYYIRLNETPVNTTNTLANFSLCVAHNSQNPEKAVEFIKLLNTDGTLVDLITWGELDTDYILDENNCVDAEDYAAREGTYQYAAAFLIGNEAVATPSDSYGPTYVDEIKEYNTIAVDSQAAGFSFDYENVAAQVAAVESVNAEFLPTVRSGLVDPEYVLPEYLNKLEAAGINDIIAEKQKQLDAWKESVE